MKHSPLNFQQICGIDNTHIVISFSRCILAVERKVQPVERYGVQHIGFYPVKRRVIRGRKNRSYMEFEVVRADRGWWRCAHWYHRTKTIALTQTRRDNNCRASFNHFWWNEPREVANDNRSLLWMKVNSHKSLCRHVHSALQYATPNV